MIGYATLGTNDLDRAGGFYDKIAEALGGKRVFKNDRGIGWSVNRGPMLMLMKPFDGHAASVGNGTMIALVVCSGCSWNPSESSTPMRSGLRRSTIITCCSRSGQAG